jgi:hypothetical protein
MARLCLRAITINNIKELLEGYMFVQHSRIAANGDSEGTPVAILETSAAGLPVVSMSCRDSKYCKA